jgi:hypothetical protein
MIPAVVTAGDRRAAKAVYGESKVYLELGGLPLVAHVVAVLQQVPEVSEVWVVGNEERLKGVFERPEVRARLAKPLHIVAQFRNLYENAWETFRRILPGAGPEGRDPVSEADLDQRVLYLPGDLPFATPQEISAFIRRGLANGCVYSVGLATDESLQDFYPTEAGDPGIRMAYFNFREGRIRQNNLHLVQPARLGNRGYIEKMYEARHQRELWDIVKLAWDLLWMEQGGFTVLYYYALMHTAGVVDRRGFRGLADRIRKWIPTARIEKGCGLLLAGSFKMEICQAGGCAIDIDQEEDYDAAKARFDEWKRVQAARAERIYGPPALPAQSSAGEGSTS